MAFLTYINKEGNLTEIPIDATNIQVLDIKGRFQHKNLEDVIGEIGTGSAENVSRIEQEIGEEELQTESGTIKGAINEVNIQLNDLTKKVDNIKVPDGTTAEKGIVQLENSVSSTATDKAATPNSVKSAYDLASTANGNAELALSRANEAFQSASNGKTAIAGVLGYVSGGNTHQELANEAQYCKNIMANNLNAKGVGANGNSALRDLANSIGNISVQSLGGKPFATGVTEFTNSDGASTTINLPFKPALVFGIICSTDSKLTPNMVIYTDSSLVVGGINLYILKDYGKAFYAQIDSNGNNFVITVKASIYLKSPVKWVAFGL